MYGTIRGRCHVDLYCGDNRPHLVGADAVTIAYLGGLLVCAPSQRLH